MRTSPIPETPSVRETAPPTRRTQAAAIHSMTEQVYTELKRIAAIHLRRERPGGTLQPTVLVHEAYLSLAGGPLEFEGRSHFLGIAARAMRQILVHHARARNAGKRGGGEPLIPFREDMVVTVDAAAGVEQLHDALNELERTDPRKARVVELRFFGGLTEAETAELLGVSVPTVAREMRVARALLLQSMLGDGREKSGGEIPQSKS